MPDIKEKKSLDEQNRNGASDAGVRVVMSARTEQHGNVVNVIHENDTTTHKTGDVTNKDGDVTNRDGDVTNRDCDVTNRDGDITNRDGDVTKKDCDVTNRDGDVKNKDCDVTHKDGDVTNKDGNIHASHKDGDVTDKDGDVLHQIGDTTNKACNVIYKHKNDDVICQTNDVVLLVQNEEISCNKSKLQAVSSYFSAMFSSGMIESTSKQITIHDVDPIIMNILVHYAESDPHDLLIRPKTSLNLLHIATMLQFDSVISILKDYFLENITTENCCGVICVSDVCGLCELHDRAKLFACWNFDGILESDDLGEMAFRMFHELISHPGIRTSSEVNILRVVEKWLSCNKEHGAHLQDFITCINWANIEGLSTILSSSLLCDEARRKDITERWKNIDQHVDCGRYPPVSLVVLSGDVLTDPNRMLGKAQCTSAVTSYPIRDGKVMTADVLTSLPADYSQVWAHNACTIGADLYIIGGMNGHFRTLYTGVWKYSSLYNQWTKLAVLPSLRRHHTIVADGRYIYVIGGFGRYRVILETVFRYDTKNDQWEEQPSLHRPRFSVAACCCQGSIYVFSDPNLEILHPGAKSWQLKSDILPRANTTLWAVAHGASIYTIEDFSSTLYVFDTASEQLTRLGNFRGSVGRAVVMDTKIYLVNGCPNTIIESYDIQKKTFTVEYEVKVNRKDFHVVVLPTFR